MDASIGRDVAEQIDAALALLKPLLTNALPRDRQDQVRAVLYSLRLSSRALEFAGGYSPENHYEYSSPESMIRQGRDLLESVSAGRDPLVGQFAEIDGLCVDHALIEVDGIFHIFYIRLKAGFMWQELPMGDFGHATSTDLIHWDVQEPVLPTLPGTWENTHVWAPHVIERDGRYLMYYTGVNENAAQGIGIATSTDLVRWDRVSEGPAITPGSWGAWDPRVFSNCRDAFVLDLGDVQYCYYTAQTHDGTYCVGISRSSDLVNWSDCGYVTLSRSLDTPPESPFVVVRNGVFHLFYTSYRDGTVVAQSNRPDGGFVDVDGDAGIVIAGVSASELLETVSGEWVISAISHSPNNLHFMEFFHLNWPSAENSRFSVQPLALAHSTSDH